MSRSIVDDRLQWATYGFMGLVALAAYSQASVQVIRRGDVLARASASNKFVQSVVDSAKRGRILCADGRPLAQDDDSYTLQIDFQKVPHSEGFFADLAAATGTPASEFRELALAGKGNVVWHTPLSLDQSSKVRDVKTTWRANGLSIQRSGNRSYMLAEAAADIVGQIKDDKAQSGLELSQNTALAGKDGKTVGLVDRTGAFLPMRLDKQGSLPKTDGVDITTTIDFDLQQAASRAIQKAVDAHGASQGVAIVMDPHTGDILAMSCWPTFDPTLDGEKTSKMARTSDINPATQSAFEPGSTFKLLTLAKALDKGVVKPTDHFICRGSETVGKKTFQCDKHESHGDMLMADAIAKSCNVTASRWSRKVGHDDFVNYIENLGLLDKPGIGLPYEAHGRFSFNDPAKELQLALVGFGQAINVTPCSLAGAFCMIGNEGKLMFPRLIAKIGTKEFPPEESMQVVKPQSAELVLKCMEAVIDSPEGTGHDLRIPGYRLAGKTGTAQTIGRGGSDGHVSNFVGFVPAQNPKALILVMVDHPTNGYYGAVVAGPVFQDLAREVIRRYNIPRTEPLNEGVPSDVAALMLHGGASSQKVPSKPSRGAVALHRRHGAAHA